MTERSKLDADQFEYPPLLMSTSVQSRVKAFESLAGSSAPSQMHDLLDHSAQNLPYAPRQRKSPSPSPPTLGLKTSLIDLKDWVVDDGSPPRTNGFHAKKTPTKTTFIPPLINLDPDSPPKTPKAPPLPPRKPSTGNLRSFSSSSLPIAKHSAPPIATRRSDSLTVEHTYPPPPKLEPNRSRHAPASSVSSFQSVSLSSDTDPGTPGSVSSNFIATYPIDHDDDAISLDESFENVSTTSLGSPTTTILNNDWSKPSLPPRPSASTSTSSSSGRRPPPPPPPSSYAERSSASDRSSLLSNKSTLSSASNTTATSFTSASTHNPSIRSLKSPPLLPLKNPTLSPLPNLTVNSLPTTRPTPIPSAVRPRYEQLFNGIVVQKRKAQLLRNREWEKAGRPSLLSPGPLSPRRTRPGWRGLSIDLITGGDDLLNTSDSTGQRGIETNEELDVDTHVGPTERLEGYIVRIVWSRSKLPKEKLGAIWSECDPSTKGSLDRDSFCKGMWRIDEELRKSQMGIGRVPSSPATSISSITSSWTTVGRTPIQMRSRDFLR
ncbi:hypothetical protein D9758_000805 [Tetrapyrgos nigripes]|uniref:EH domain-containing protein n=1 Tax=Tetrapyrgos nigripes TaxID=182062 RepID=A0A8H5GZ77_9AGAR|nr:hypothetical protein D9758_000805 [Tetrapyrgos nigripes]